MEVNQKRWNSRQSSYIQYNLFMPYDKINTESEKNSSLNRSIQEVGATKILA